MFTSAQLKALRTLVRLWTVEKFVLIGASAMIWRLGSKGRQTNDLDMILAVGLDRYPAGLESEPGWSRHPKREQTWLSPDGMQVDVIPVGREERRAGVLKWPKSEFVMDLTGMRLALETAETIQPSPGLTIRVAPVEVLALLKMVAFLDRPHDRDRDLSDIALILDAYVGDDDDRRYSDEVLDLALGFDAISPFLLGKRLGALVNQPERDAVERFIAMVRGTGDPTAAQARMLVNAPTSWHRDPEELLLRIAAFERGFSPSSPTPRG